MSLPGHVPPLILSVGPCFELGACSCLDVACVSLHPSLPRVELGRPRQKERDGASSEGRAALRG